MSERGSEFDVVDQVDWSRFAGQGADVRKRGERARRRQTAGVMGGVAVVAAAAIAVGSLAGMSVISPAGPSAHPSTRPVVTPDPTTGFLDTTDLGPSFRVDTAPTTGVPADTALSGMKSDCSASVKEPLRIQAQGRLYRGTVADANGPHIAGLPDGLNEFIVNESFYPLPDGKGALGFAEYKASVTCEVGKSADGLKVADLRGVGDEAFVVSSKAVGGRSFGIRVGDVVVLVEVLCGGAGVDVPIPGGDAWVAQVAQKAVERLKTGG